MWLCQRAKSKIVNYPIQTGVKVKESTKFGKYLNLARELKNLQNESDGFAYDYRNT